MKKQIDLSIKFAGEYKLVLNEGTDKETSTGWFHNLITDAGLNRLGVAGNTSILQWCSIGTGSTTPAFADTSLVGHYASTSSRTFDSQSNLGASTYIGNLQMHWTFTQGAVVGVMAEVGVGWATGGGSLWSRALILDGTATPTTLTVTSLDQLSVYYRLQCVPDLTDLTDSFDLSGVTYNYTGRIAGCSGFASGISSMMDSTGTNYSSSFGAVTSMTSYPSTSALGAITGSPTGSGTGAINSVSLAGYSAGSHYRDSTVTCGPTQGNSAGGIGTVLVTFPNAQFQYIFSPVIPKTNTKTLTIPFRFSWDRV